MTGSYNVKLEANGEILYDFTLNRNFTTIIGDSGGGKTLLINTIMDVALSGNDGNNTKLYCDVNCIGIPEGTQYSFLVGLVKTNRNTIFFIDEGAQHINTTKFSTLIRGSDNYFVIVGRDRLGCISYSYKSVMRLSMDVQGFLTLKPLLELDGDLIMVSEITKDDVFLPEDAKAGYNLIKTALSEYNVVRGGGRDYYQHYIKHILDPTDDIVLLQDGAAFGSQINSLLNFLTEEGKGRVKAVLLRESFEYMVLDAIPSFNAQTALSPLEQIIDSKNYLSWELYFTDVLKSCLEPRGLTYDKSEILSILSEEEIAAFREYLLGYLKLKTDSPSSLTLF